MANMNWSGSALTQYRFKADAFGNTFRAPGKAWLKIDVETQHPVGYLLESMLTFLHVPLNGLTFTAVAQTTIDSPQELSQVAPLAIRCPDPCTPPWPGWDPSIFNAQRTWPLDPLNNTDSADDAPIDFTYRPDPGNVQFSTLMPLEQFPGATAGDIGNELASCNPSVAGAACGMDISTPSAVRHLDAADDPAANQLADELRAALNTHGAWNQLVAVYQGDPAPNTPLDIVGFAAVTIENVNDGPGGPVTISVTFHKMFYDAAHTRGDGLYDFGVRTIGLSG